MTEAAFPVVLVVDDEPFVRHLIEHVVSRAGCTVLTAENGAQALDVLNARSDVRLVISDLGMPDLDGFGLLGTLHARGGPPVVVLTSRGDEEDERRAKALGAADVITKPFSRQDLLGVLSRHVGR